MQIKDLKKFPKNPRKMTDKKLEMLGKSMEEFGDLSGIIFNCRTGHLIGGHQRVKNLKPEWAIEKKEFTDNLGTVAQGFVKTPFGDWTYREVDWDPKKEIAANIAANKHSGEWDIPVLKDLLAEIDDGALDMELTGFEQIELDDLFGRDPGFKPGSQDEQGRLDQRTPIKCPECGAEFIPK